MITRSRTLLTLPVVALCLAAAGCGDDAAGDAAGTATEPAAADTTAAEPGTTTATPTSAATPTTVTAETAGAGQREPVTVDQCSGEEKDRSVTFDSIPEQVFTIDPQSAEFLIALGLGDRIVGTWFSYSDEELAQFPEYADEVKAVPVLGDDEVWPPTAEVIAASGADSVFTIYRLNIEGYLDATRLEEDLGIKTYGFVTYCTGGVMRDLEPMYDDIENLGLIFDVPDAADALIEKIEGQVAEAAVLLGEREPVTVWQYAGEEIPYPAGGTGVPNAVITLGGGTNVFEDVDAFYGEVSWEQVVERNPSVIWMQTDAGPGFIEAADGIEKAIETNPGLADVDAVAAERYVTVNYNTGGTINVHAGEAVLQFAEQIVALDL